MVIGGGYKLTTVVCLDLKAGKSNVFVNCLLINKHDSDPQMFDCFYSHRRSFLRTLS